MLRQWRRRRIDAQAAAYDRTLATYRERFPGESETLIRALAAGGPIAACAMRAIVESRERQAHDERLRRIIREELAAWRTRARLEARQVTPGAQSRALTHGRQTEPMEKSATAAAAANYLELLGLKVKDRVTGFTGIAESISWDLYGCIQAVVRPPVDDKGAMPDGKWIDVLRLEVLDATPIMAIPGGYQTYGTGPTTTVVPNGAADKPAR